MSAVSPIYSRVKGDVRPLAKNILVTNMEQGEKVTAGGIIMLDDNGKDRGIRPRWCQVYKVGSEVSDVEVGQWILVEHGRWTWGVDVTDANGEVKRIQRVDPKGIMVVTNDCPL